MSFPTIHGHDRTTAVELFEQHKREKTELIVIAANDIFDTAQKIHEQTANQQDITNLFTRLPESNHIDCARCVLNDLFQYFQAKGPIEDFKAIGIYAVLSQNPIFNVLLQLETFRSDFFTLLINKAITFEAGAYNPQFTAIGILELYLEQFMPTKQDSQRHVTRLFELTPDHQNLGYFSALEVLLSKMQKSSLTDFVEPLYQRFLNEAPSKTPLHTSTIVNKNLIILRSLLIKELLSPEFLGSNFGKADLNAGDVRDGLGETGMHTRAMTEDVMYRV